MAKTYTIRRNPCTHCQRPVVVIEMSSVGLGGLLHFWSSQHRGAPRIALQHGDYEPVPGQLDHVDNACTREPETI